MSSYAYVALDARGLETRGTLDVSDQEEALRRIREMGLFPTRLIASDPEKAGASSRGLSRAFPARSARRRRFRRGVSSVVLSTFTRNLATLLDAGMPLLRGLRTLREQEEDKEMGRVIEEVARAIEEGGSLAEGLARNPRIFSRLYVNMVRAGEVSGALEVALLRLAEFLEKAQKIKGRVKTAMVYPSAVLFVAAAVLVLMVTLIIPRFREVFSDLMDGAPLPSFTLFVFQLSEGLRHNLLTVAGGVAGLIVTGWLLRRTRRGRGWIDWWKLTMPAVGPVFRKVALSRFARTLGTLSGSGVPLLQALMIVKETAGNAVVGRVVATVHERVKEGDAIAPTLRSSPVFPAMVAGMVDIGEQTGALPEMLLKIADRCDEEVDNAVNAMTALLEPALLVFLAVVVGGIVIAMFLPIIDIISNGPNRNSGVDV